MSSITTESVESVREYWDRRPCNIRHSDAPLGTREYFDQVETRKYFVEPHIPAFAEFDRWKGKRVLEIGCGIGTDAVNFARSGADYTAIELSSASLEMTQRRFDVYGLTGRFFCGNSEELPNIIPVEQYDLVYSFGVIHHTPRPERVINHVKAYLGPSSEFRLMMYARHSWKQAFIEAGLDQPEAQFGCPIAWTYSKEEMSQLLGEFEILELRQDHIFPYVVDEYVRYNYVREPWFQAMSPEMFTALEKSLGWHMLAKCRLPAGNASR